jgi:hypothetical protein
MSWKTTAEKERFFEELDRTFNTSPGKPVIVPQLHKPAPTKPLILTSSPPPKRRLSETVWLERECTKNANKTPATRYTSRQAAVNPTRRPLSAKRKASKEIIPQKKSDLLDGMVLYFIPNSKKNGVRKFRMDLFAQHGADVRDTWSEQITHVICDKTVTGERVLRDLRWEQFPVRRPIYRLIKLIT